MAKPIVVYRGKRLDPLRDYLEDPGQRAYDRGQIAGVKGLVARGLQNAVFLVDKLTNARTPGRVQSLLDDFDRSASPESLR